MWEGSGSRTNLSMCPAAAPSPLPYRETYTGEEKTMAARVSGDWEHGACLGPLQASRRQRHVRNSALLSSALRRVASPSGFRTQRVSPSVVDPSKKKKKSFLEGLEVNKLLIVIAMQEGIIHGGISLSRFRQLEPFE